MCHVSGLYLPNGSNTLREKGGAWGLDKFSGGSFGVRAHQTTKNRGRREGQTSPTWPTLTHACPQGAGHLFRGLLP
jgi:hypothetical protein